MKNKSLFLLLLLPVFSSHPATCKDIPIQIAFTISGRLIFIQGMANDQEGAFLVDTGNSQLVLNRDYFFSRHTGDGHIVDINGNSHEMGNTCVDLIIGSLQRKCEPAHLLDISSLEQKLGFPVLGLLGNHFFRNFELMFDYQKQVLNLFPIDKKGNRLEDSGGEYPLQSISILCMGDLPFIEVEVNGEKLNMLLDCGAAANMVSLRRKEKIGAALQARGKAGLIGVGAKVVPVMSVMMEGLSIEEISYPPMITLLVREFPLDYCYNGPLIDGVLGFDFFRQHRLSINFRKKELRIWEIQGKAMLDEPPMAKTKH